jgi:2'-5' RNA ligase
MVPHLRVQASLPLSPLPGLVELRRALDPRMAGRIAPHVTAIYDDEAPDPDLLMERLRVVCADLPPVDLRLGCVEAFAPPGGGLFVSTEAGAAFATLRALVLTPPFAARRAVRPHVTLLHPRSVADAPADWRSHVGCAFGWETTVREVAIMESDGGCWRVKARISFGGQEDREAVLS